jgi:hypothetical protein
VDPRELARLHALGRVVVGLALTAAPGRAGASWIGRDAGRPGARVMTRAMGARDLAIGLGAAYTAGQGYGAKPWQLAGALADTADLVATLRARDALPSTAVVGVGAVAAGSALLGLWFQAALD